MAGQAPPAFRFAPGGLELSDVDIDAGGAKAKGAVSLRGGRPATADLTLAVGPGAFLPQGRGRARPRSSTRRAERVATLDLTAEDDRQRRLEGPHARGQGRRSAGAPAAERSTPVARRPAAAGAGRNRRELAQTAKTMADLDAAGRMGAPRSRPARPPSSASAAPRPRPACGCGRRSAGRSRRRRGRRPATLKAKLAGVSLTAFDPDLAGDIDGTFNLHGQGETLLGEFDAKLIGARERGLEDRAIAERRDPAATCATASDDHQRQRRQRQGLKAEADLTCRPRPRPSRSSGDRRAAPVRGNFSAQGEIKPLWDLLLGPSARVGQDRRPGQLAGTLADPRDVGRAALDGGRLRGRPDRSAPAQRHVRMGLADNAIDVSQVERRKTVRAAR
jgi:translocation and assembly module TamB